MLPRGAGERKGESPREAGLQRGARARVVLRIVQTERVKLFLRLVNLVPLFAALLIVGTGWKLFWQHVAANARRGSVLSALAGAAFYQLD